MSAMPPSPFLEFPSSAGGGEMQTRYSVQEGVSYPEDQANTLSSREIYRETGEEAPSGPRSGSRIETVGVAPDPAETARFVLDEDRFMAEIEQPPAFIVMPSQGYLLACEREQTDVILDFLNGN